MACGQKSHTRGSSGASYELKLDTDGDALPDLAFHVLFASAGKEATAAVCRASGTAAQGTGPVGDAVIRDAPVSPAGEVHIAEAGGYTGSLPACGAIRVSRMSRASEMIFGSRATIPSPIETSSALSSRSRTKRLGPQARFARPEGLASQPTGRPALRMSNSELEPVQMAQSTTESSANLRPTLGP